MNKTMVIGLSVLLCLYLAFGLMGCKADEAVFPNHESTEIYTFSTNGEPGSVFATEEQCESYRKYIITARNSVCIPGRGVRPER